MELNHLHENNLLQIFEFLSIKELIGIQRVCTLWKILAERILKSKKSIICIDYDQNVENHSYFDKPFCIKRCQHDFNKVKLHMNNFWHELRFITEKCPNVTSLSVPFGYSNEISNESLDQNESKIKYFFDNGSLDKLECLCIELYFYTYKWNLPNIILNISSRLKHLKVLYYAREVLLIPLMPLMEDLHIDGNVWFKNGFEDVENMNNLKRFTFKTYLSFIEGFILIKSPNNNSNNIKSFVHLIKFLKNNHVIEKSICNHPFMISDLDLFEKTFKNFTLNSLTIDFYFCKDKAFIKSLKFFLHHFEDLITFKITDHFVSIDTICNSTSNAMPNLKFLSLPYGKINCLEMEKIAKLHPLLEKLEFHEKTDLDKNYIKLSEDNNNATKFWCSIANMINLKQLILNLDCSSDKCFYKFNGFEKIKTSTSLNKIRISHKSICNELLFRMIISTCKRLAINLNNQHLNLSIYLQHDQYEKTDFRNYVKELPRNMRFIKGKWDLYPL